MAAAKAAGSLIRIKGLELSIENAVEKDYRTHGSGVWRVIGQGARLKMKTAWIDNLKL